VKLILTLLAIAISACSQAQKMQDTQIIWHDGNCFLYVKNLSAQQAKAMQKSIKFADCNVIFDDDLTEGTKK
jgi:hypothetical protein